MTVPRKSLITGAAALALAAGAVTTGAPARARVDAHPAAASPAWSIQPTPSPKGATQTWLYGVSCTSATACTAAGTVDEGSANPDLTLAERWDGASWAVQATPSEGLSTLHDVSCSAATACTAVGSGSVGSAAPALAERWNGTAWKIQDLPAGNGTFDGVSCPSATACTAVGSNYDGGVLAERWDGASWAVQDAPNPGTDQFDGVSCPSVTACTAVGSYENSSDVYVTLAERWNGTTWKAQQPPNPAHGTQITLVGVSCTSAAACTAVGVYYDKAGAGVALAERWNGSGWKMQTLASPSGAAGTYLNAVSCTSATACTAVGGYYTSSSSNLPLAEQWNGTSWKVQDMANPDGTQVQVNGVSCTAATTCTAVGYYDKGADTDVPLAETEKG